MSIGWARNTYITHTHHTPIQNESNKSIDSSLHMLPTIGREKAGVGFNFIYVEGDSTYAAKFRDFQFDSAGHIMLFDVQIESMVGQRFGALDKFARFG